MTERGEWLAILDVALDALRMKDYERAWTLFDELDRLHSTWLFEIKRAPVRRDVGKQETPAKQVIAWMMSKSGFTLAQIGAFLDGVTTETARRYALGGERQIEQRAFELYTGRPFDPTRMLARSGAMFGDLEEDFEPEDVRRLRRRGVLTPVE